ncbi:tryptophan transporter [Tepidibacter hydrothermalis]|uniref:Tryptophan transporter n=1 Tax=Tepidibacter hydrothermalis TaxID=3036126 RepID=A0ABY8E7X1_9FIRM|nr:tryptophan transporter [Tepidibacter hydrothermalis]WFD08990.1 tryptophan transporter [Tepidibacter hydrothermalis]
MNLRKNILTALLLAIGFILHGIMPGIAAGMKFDLMLAMMVVAILINCELKNTLLTGVLGGFMTAMTTTFPGGQIANVIDKIVTCIAVYLMVKLIGKYKEKQISVAVIGFLATIVSGSVFLISALVIVGLPASFKTLFLTIVLPTSFTNIFVIILIYNCVNTAIRISGSKFVSR